MTARNFCSSCGSGLDAGSAFCGNCGVRVPSCVPTPAVHPFQTLPNSAQGESPRVPNLNVSGDTVLRSEAKTASKPDVPAYAGTLFGAVPKEPASMFSATTFTDEETPEREWFEQTWVVVVLLLFLFPVGMILLWKNPFFSKGNKLAISFGCAISIAVLLVFVPLLMINEIESEADRYASNSSSRSVASASSTPSTAPATSTSSIAPFTTRQTIDFASPSEVFSSIGAIRESCLARGNNRCAIICEKYQTTLIDINRALTQSDYIDPSTREPSYASTFQSYYKGCVGTANE